MCANSLTLHERLKKDKSEDLCSLWHHVFTCFSSYLSIPHSTPTHRSWNPLHTVRFIWHIFIPLFCSMVRGFIILWCAWYGCGYFGFCADEKSLCGESPCLSTTNIEERSSTFSLYWLLSVFNLPPFMAASDEIIKQASSQAPPLWCIRHLSDLFSSASSVFSAMPSSTSREIPKDRTLTHSQKAVSKPLLLSFFFYFYISHKVSLSP